MSSDNGIYVLKTKGPEWRVSHLQAIDNIYYWANCCENPHIEEEITRYDEHMNPNFCYHEKCFNCGALDPEWEKREEINNENIFNYFKDSLVYNSEEDAMKKADEIYAGIINDDFSGLVEYGICIINGLENREFPKGE